MRSLTYQPTEASPGSVYAVWIFTSDLTTALGEGNRGYSFSVSRTTDERLIVQDEEQTDANDEVSSTVDVMTTSYEDYCC